MATERQIAANRKNALRSTGPKSLAGKIRSSGNAYRHGLSSPLQFDPSLSERAEAIACVVAGNKAGERELAAAMDFAWAQLQHNRIAATQRELMMSLRSAGCKPRLLRRLLALDRYGRYAQTTRRRALVHLANSTAAGFCQNEPNFVQPNQKLQKR